MKKQTIAVTVCLLLVATGALAQTVKVNWVAVGIPVARYPPHRSVRALVSAYGSYLGCKAAKRAVGQG